MPRRFPIGFNSREQCNPGAAGVCSVMSAKTPSKILQIYLPESFAMLDLTFDGVSQMLSPNALMGEVLSGIPIDLDVPGDTVIELRVQNVGQSPLYCYGGLLCEPVATKPIETHAPAPVATPTNATPSAADVTREIDALTSPPAK